MKPSPIVEKLTKVDAITVGMKVTHPARGKGEVVRVELEVPHARVLADARGRRRRRRIGASERRHRVALARLVALARPLPLGRQVRLLPHREPPAAPGPPRSRRTRGTRERRLVVFAGSGSRYDPGVSRLIVENVRSSYSSSSTLLVDSPKVWAMILTTYRAAGVVYDMTQATADGAVILGDKEHPEVTEIYNTGCVVDLAEALMGKGGNDLCLEMKAYNDHDEAAKQASARPRRSGGSGSRRVAWATRGAAARALPCDGGFSDVAVLINPVEVRNSPLSVQEASTSQKHLVKCHQNRTVGAQMGRTIGKATQREQCQRETNIYMCTLAPILMTYMIIKLVTTPTLQANI